MEFTGSPRVDVVALGDVNAVRLYRSQQLARRNKPSQVLHLGHERSCCYHFCCPTSCLVITTAAGAAGGAVVGLQGIRSWLVLKSQLGQPVGAVQVSVAFTHIGGAAHDTCPAAACPLSR